MNDIGHPVLLIVRGMPGSGKTYLAAELQKAIGPDGLVMLDPDTIDFAGPGYAAHTQEQSAKGVDPAKHPYWFLKNQAMEAVVAHKIILWNQPFTNLDMFRKLTSSLQAYALEHGTELSVLVVEVAIDPVLAKERVLQRMREGGHGPSEATLDRRIADYKSFIDEGYDVITVQGDTDVQSSVSTVMRALQKA